MKALPDAIQSRRIKAMAPFSLFLLSALHRMAMAVIVSGFLLAAMACILT